MFLELCARATQVVKPGSLKNAANMDAKTIFFVACVLAALPLDIAQLSFVIIGAFFFAALKDRWGQLKPKKQPFSVVVDTAAYAMAAWKPKTGTCVKRPAAIAGTHAKNLPPSVTLEVRATSVQPIVAPTFLSGGWEGEIEELLIQITPTLDAELVVSQIAQRVRQTMQAMIPEIEVNGFANGNLTSGKAFGVAVPEVDIVANISPHVLLMRLHGRSPQGSASQVDVKKIQKAALRACTDRLVAGGFKFRRSAFRGEEPKITMLVPAPLGFFSEAIPINFSINVTTPLYNAALLAECGRIDSRAKELMLIVKRWAKDRGICHAAKGHLSPYLWGLLSIYFLQVRSTGEGQLLPALEHFQMPSALKGKTTADSSKKPAGKPIQTSEPTESAGVLFKEFVHFFEAQFDWRNEAVSIRLGRRSPPSLDLPLHIIVSEDSTTQTGPSIEDPLNAFQNLGDGMNAVSLARLKEEFSRAETICSRSASLSELLEPWSPPADVVDPHEDAEQENISYEPLLGVSSIRMSTNIEAAHQKLPEMPLPIGNDWRRDTIEEQASTIPRPSTPPWRRSGAVVAAKATS